jgi:hypothetical protein
MILIKTKYVLHAILLSQSVMGYRKCCRDNELLSMDYSNIDRGLFCKERESTQIWNLGPNGNDLPVSPTGYGLPKCNEYQMHFFTGSKYDKMNNSLHIIGKISNPIPA